MRVCLSVCLSDRSFPQTLDVKVRDFGQTVQIHDSITDNEFDVLFISQTGLYDQGDEACITEMTPNGYQFHSFPRCGRGGGGGGGRGIALVSKCSLKSVSVKRLNYQCAYRQKSQCRDTFAYRYSLLWSADNEFESLLTSLDQSAAFDTID